MGIYPPIFILRKANFSEFVPALLTDPKIRIIIFVERSTRRLSWTKTT